MQSKSLTLQWLRAVLFVAAVILMFFTPLQLLAQEDPDREEQEESKIEQIFENTDAELDYSSLLQELDYLKKNPINLNRTNLEELRSLYFLTEIQINNLLEHIRINGKMLSIYELQAVPGWDIETIMKALPYVTVKTDAGATQFHFSDIFKHGSSDLMIRYARVLEDQAGYADVSDSLKQAKPGSYYLGSPDKIYARYRFKYYNKLSFGVTMEKDAGEEVFKGTQKNGFDFYSAHFYVKNLGFVKTLAVGDYTVSFGQGLTLWSGLGFGKSSDAVYIKKLARGIMPYASVNEFGFMRGVATTVGIKNFELSAFFSSKKIDGNVTSDTLNSEEFYITSIQEDGIHATYSDMYNRKKIGETMYGGNLAYKTSFFSIGLTGYRTEYSVPIKRKLRYYNQFDFTGDHNTNLGIDYSLILRNFNFFGEASRSENGGMAFINGIIVSLDKHISLAVSYRNFMKNYQAALASPFSEGSNPSNEEAIYTGVEIKFNNKWLLTAYVDNFSFPWLKYRIDAPSMGQDYIVRLNHKPTKKIDMHVRFKYETKGINAPSSSENLINFAENYTKQSFRYHISLPVSPSFTLKNRIEFIRHEQDSKKAETGYIIYQDIRYKSMHSPLTVTLRYCLFDTDGYESRIYTYESDVLYAYSVPGLYYKGTRWYLLLQYHLMRGVDLYLRYAQTAYTNRNSISSGMYEINGNTKSEIKAQLRIRF